MLLITKHIVSINYMKAQFQMNNIRIVILNIFTCLLFFVLLVWLSVSCIENGVQRQKDNFTELSNKNEITKWENHIIQFLALLIVVGYVIKLRRKNNDIKLYYNNIIIERENTITKLKQEINHMIENEQLLVDEKKKQEVLCVQQEGEISNLRALIDDTQYSILKEKTIYKHIKQLDENITKRSTGEVLNYQDRLKLEKELNSSLASFINTIQWNCPSLTKEEIQICCFVKLKLSAATISYCKGYSGTGALRQHKFRIKKKMKDHQCEKLYYSIFK